MIRLDIKNYNTILIRKLQILTLSSGKIDKHEYLRGKEILPTDQSRIIEQDCFTFSPLGKMFGKEIKTIENQLKTQISNWREWEIIS